MARVKIDESLNIPKVRVTVRSDKSILNPDIIDTIFDVYDSAEKYNGRPVESKSFPERMGKRTSAEFCLIFPNRDCLKQFCDELDYIL